MTSYYDILQSRSRISPRYRAGRHKRKRYEKDQAGFRYVEGEVQYELIQVVVNDYRIRVAAFPLRVDADVVVHLEELRHGIYLPVHVGVCEGNREVEGLLDGAQHCGRHTFTAAQHDGRQVVGHLAQVGALARGQFVHRIKLACTLHLQQVPDTNEGAVGLLAVIVELMGRKSTVR